MMLKKLKLAILAAEAAEAECTTAEAYFGEVRATAKADAETASKAAEAASKADDAWATAAGNARAANTKVCKILQKMLAQYS